MDPNEIFEYVTEGMKWLAVGGGSYLGALVGSQAFFQTALFRKKIQSQEELDVIVDEEARKLNLDPTLIDAKYNGESAFVSKNGERYDLHLTGNWTSTRQTVKHELYHILKDCSKGREATLPYYLFIAEPRATLYGCFNIRI